MSTQDHTSLSLSKQPSNATASATSDLQNPAMINAQLVQPVPPAFQEAIQDLQTTVEKLKLELMRSEEKAEKYKRMLFGSRSEKFKKEEILEPCLELFEPNEILTDEAAAEKPKPKARKNNSKGRGSNFNHVEVDEERECKVPEEELPCDQCGKQMVEIGKDESHKLKYIPGYFRRMKISKQKVACKCKKSKIITAKVPSAIPGCMADESLLVQVATSKYIDSMPLYRQSQTYKRLGVKLNSTTLLEWLKQSANALKGVYESIHRQVLEKPYIMADETPIKMQEKGRANTKKSFLWAIGPSEGQVFFRFDPSRSTKAADKILLDYPGKLQVDGYVSYVTWARENKKKNLYHCWSHARRKIENAHVPADPHTGKLLKAYGLLFTIDRYAKEKGMTQAKRLELRQRYGQMALSILKHHLVRTRDSGFYAPGSAVLRGIKYTLDRWESLSNILDTASVELSTNLIEQEMRKPAVGRKNYLFVGSEAGGEVAAIFYTLFGSCKRLGISPHEYLLDVLRLLPITAAVDHGSLTPERWALNQEVEEALLEKA